MFGDQRKCRSEAAAFWGCAVAGRPTSLWAAPGGKGQLLPPETGSSLRQGLHSQCLLGKGISALTLLEGQAPRTRGSCVSRTSASWCGRNLPSGLRRFSREKCQVDVALSGEAGGHQHEGTVTASSP